MQTAYDIFCDDDQPLKAFFSPQTVAVIGATEQPQTVGRTVLWNLISSPFGGTIFPVNPQRQSVLGIPTYPTLDLVPQPIDLAILATPTATQIKTVQDCVKAGVKAAILLCDDGRETGSLDREQEQQILAIARQGKLRIIGLNSLGIMNPLTGLNASVTQAIAQPGNVGFISQSGALCSSILDWSFQENVGFSAFISIGSMLDVGWGDLIYYLGDDPQTESIVIYMESIGNARSFLSAAREVALTKPIIVIKAGRTSAAAEAVVSHTGRLMESNDVLDAAFRRCGVLRVKRFAHMFFLAELLSKQPRPKGRRLTILTNAGGLGILSMDTLISEGGELAQLTPETLTALNDCLPSLWSHQNPIDILGDADPQRYTKSAEIALKDPNSDGLLMILTPQLKSDPTQTAELLSHLSLPPKKRKPILASWMGGAEVAAGTKILSQANIATFAYPDTAVRIFNYMWRYSYNLQGIYETPSLPRQVSNPELSCDLTQHIIQSALAENRTLLTEFESKQLLAAYQIPVVETQITTDVTTAIEMAEAMGYPVVLKLHSHTITHKREAGGVYLNLQNAEQVQTAYETMKAQIQESDFQGVTVQPMILDPGYELILGSHIDPKFGPVLLFGAGGQWIEVYQDQALGLPPLNTTLARRMMAQTKIYHALKGVSGQATVNLAMLEQIMVSFANLVLEQPWVKEIEINPLLVTAEQIVALDAHAILHPKDTPEQALPQPAIRPYPHQYVTQWQMKNGTGVVIRPIRPEDEPMAVKFHETLSTESVYLRYAHLFKLSQRVAHQRLSRLCFIDYDQEMALVVIYQDPATQIEEMIAVARLSRVHGVREAEFSMLISDRFQHQGLGTELLRQLIEIARQEQISRLTAEILADNRGMQKVCERLGFRLERILGEPMFHAELEVC